MSQITTRWMSQKGKGQRGSVTRKMDDNWTDGVLKAYNGALEAYMVAMNRRIDNAADKQAKDMTDLCLEVAEDRAIQTAGVQE